MTVTRPARLTGAALCAVLALVSAVWILKDLTAVGSPEDLLWAWAGDYHYLRVGGVATSLLDPLLLAVAVVAALAALRSGHAASALAATGALTLAVRLPGVWRPDNGALVTSLLDLVLGLGLIVIAAAGRRDPRTPDEPVPARPAAGRARAAGLLLLAAALVTLAWEVYIVGVELPLEYTIDRFLGGRTAFGPTLAPPPAWMSLVLVCLYGAGAVSAFTRARHARSFGLLGGAVLAAYGLLTCAQAVRSGAFGHLPDTSVLEALSLLTWLFELVAGAAVLALLAGRGAPDSTAAPQPRGGPYGSYGPYGYGPPAPPSSPPPGW